MPLLSSEFLAIWPGGPTLHRLNSTSVDVKLLADPATGSVDGAWLEYGTDADELDSVTSEQSAQPGDVLTFTLEELTAATRYYYRVAHRLDPDDAVQRSAIASFRTAPGSAAAVTVGLVGAAPFRDRYVFDTLNRSALIARTYQRIESDRPDLLIRLGDQFGVIGVGDSSDLDDVPNAPSAALLVQRAREELPYLHSSGLMDLIGDRENTWYSGGGITSAILAAMDDYFGNPAIDGGVYDVAPSGRSWKVVWGCLEIFCLDVFAATPYDSVGTEEPVTTADGRKPLQVGNWTLGEDDYGWLKAALEGSTASWRIVCWHHAPRGIDGDNRGGGGAVGARYKVAAWGTYEMGGEDDSGADWLTANRAYMTHSGSPESLHQLFVRTGVAAVFSAHDHLLAVEFLDGVRYIAVPQPAGGVLGADDLSDRYSSLSLSEQEFVVGIIGHTQLPTSGYLRVTADPTALHIDYRRCWLAGEGPDEETAHYLRIAAANSSTIQDTFNRIKEVPDILALTRTQTGESWVCSNTDSTTRAWRVGPSPVDAAVVALSPRPATTQHRYWAMVRTSGPRRDVIVRGTFRHDGSGNTTNLQAALIALRGTGSWNTGLRLQTSTSLFGLFLDGASVVTTGDAGKLLSTNWMAMELWVRGERVMAFCNGALVFDTTISGLKTTAPGDRCGIQCSVTNLSSLIECKDFSCEALEDSAKRRRLASSVARRR